MKNFQRFAIIMILLSCASCSQKNKTNQDGSFNDTLAVRNLLVQELRKNLESQPDVDSIKEWWNGMQWVVSYRIDKEFWNSQSISMIFGDINGDGLNDAIANNEFDMGGNRPWKDWTELYIERTDDGYKVKGALPLFEYRYVLAVSIKDGLIELVGYNWTENDPMCCPSIKDEFKAKLVGETFVKVVGNIENTTDPIAAEFEKAKMLADSLKQKFESGKHNLLKISYAAGGEGGAVKWACHFDSTYKLNYLIHGEYSDESRWTTYELYNQDDMILKYGYSDRWDNNNDFVIWLKQRIYNKLFDYEKKIYNYSVEEKEVVEPFVFKDKLVTYKFVTSPDDPSGHTAEKKFSEIPKEEFTYDSDSTCYRITVQIGEKEQFDYFSSEIRIDSLLFVHLFENK